MSKIGDWLDNRIGFRRLVHDLLYERIPGGARWRYVWGSTLVYTFLVQLITGLVLWTAYSPSSQTAWESVYYIQHEMTLGWFVRGLHHFTAQAMIVLLALHVVQVVIAGAYRPPREVNWWIGIGLMFVVLGLSLTGYLLPWDEKGYWATQVATKIMGIAPGIGTELQQIVVGGSQYGHHTLTRFFALHAGLLPLLFSLLLIAHLAVFRRHGITSPRNALGETTFWPNQVLRDATACLVVLGVVVTLMVWRGIPDGVVTGPEAGADLGAPADPSHAYSAARPEWYFLFLFQFLKYFPGETEVYGAIVIPTAAVVLLLLFPLLGRTRVGHAFCVVAMFALLAGVIGLTAAAVYEDRQDPDYRKAIAEAKRNGARAIELAQGLGIPKGGAVELVRNDPYLQGPILFRDNCAQCHRWNGHDGTGSPVVETRDGRELPAIPSASDLAGFGSHEWIRGLVTDPAADKYFGHTAHKDGEMARWAEENAAKLSDEEIDAVVTLLVSQAAGSDDAPPDPALLEKGVEVFSFGGAAETQACSDCHKLQHPDIFEGAGLVAAPDLTGYASRAWLTGIIRDANDERFYGEQNDGMPAFEERLSDREIELLVDWIQGRWYQPGAEGSEPASAGPVALPPPADSGPIEIDLGTPEPKVDGIPADNSDEPEP